VLFIVDALLDELDPVVLLRHALASDHIRAPLIGCRPKLLEKRQFERPNVDFFGVCVFELDALQCHYFRGVLDEPDGLEALCVLGFVP
jgi:hypothetical protein